MGKKLSAALLPVLMALPVAPSPAFAAGNQALDARFRTALPEDSRAAHALNRLTFGPRPGGIEQLNAIGLKAWIESQLHPDRIPENPLLAAKLEMLDTLDMSTDELVRRYPTPQMVRQMVSGRAPFPTGPDQLMMVRALAARIAAKHGQDGQSSPPALEEKLAAGPLLPEDLQSLRAVPPPNRIAALLAMPPGKQDEVLGALGPGMRQALFVVAPPALRRRIEMAGGPAQVVARDLAEAKMLRAIYSNRQLAEVLDDFWFNHFNVFLDKGADRYLVTAYERDVIRPRVLGKFRDLLEAVAKSPAMLFYLDNWESVGGAAAAGRGAANRVRRGLNENYARELLELHTLGVNGGYTQRDVTEVARCFTGWTITQPQRGGAFVFNPRWHDNAAKTVLGVTIPAGGGEQDAESVLDILARHPSTAHFVSLQLAVRFVADDPPPSLVNRMAARFLKSGGEIRAVLAAMLQSPEFWSAGAYRSKMKSPFEMAVSAVRAASGDVDFAFGLVNQVAQMGQPLYRKMEPNGYSNQSRDWQSTAGLVGRMNFAVQLAANRVPGVTVKAAQAAALGSPEFQNR